MTEKRYILSHNGKEDGIRDKTNDKGYYGFELARLINELSEENEQLKSTNMEMEDYLGRLEKENKQLKEENSYLNKELDYYYGRSVMTEKTYTIELIHEDIRREAENYVNQAKAMGFRKDGYGDLMAYVQLIATIAQIEHNNRIKRRIEE